MTIQPQVFQCAVGEVDAEGEKPALSFDSTSCPHAAAISRPRGQRTSVGKTATAANQTELARLAAPQTGVRVVAVFRGIDAIGEPIVAAGGLPLVAP